MARKFTLSLALVALSFAGFAGSLWKTVDKASLPAKLQWQYPVQFIAYALDEPVIKLALWNASQDPEEASVISLPMPDGSFREFRVWETPMMPQQLAAKYPQIKTFTGAAVNNPMVTAKLEYTLYGFSAMIFDGENTSFIDPYDNFNDGLYMVHYKRDEQRAFTERMHCEYKEPEIFAGGTATELMPVADGSAAPAQKTFNGHTLRTYRLALACSHQYAQAATGVSSPTIAAVLSKMTISMNRVNGVYNREFAVQMNFVANEDTLIWPTTTGSINGTDPFDAANSSGSTCLGINQTQCTNRIGSANYDLGHVFTTGGGGISGLGIVCNNSQKARSVTGLPSPVGDGFDIDYVAHEMGHEFGSGHTFNNNTDGSCSGNASSNFAYEPSSGSSILAYAGICTPDNIQAHSDAYFHASSLVQIQSKLAGSENVCAVKTSTGNKLVYLPAFSASYTIPYKTPFELIAPTAVDSVADTAVSYCWEQWNRGDFGKRIKDTYFKGPIFRSYSPKNYDTVRTFPKLSMILSGNLTAVTVSGALGEKAPDTARYLTFKLTVRNIKDGYGCFVFPDDTIHIDAISTGATNNYGGFKVTSQNVLGTAYMHGTTQTITWDVVGTDVAPISAANVKIYMSTNAGATWGYYLGTFPNSGSATVTLPTLTATSTQVRFKVKAENNVFFNINGKNVTVSTTPVSVSSPSGNLVALDQLVKVYPVPAHDVIHVNSEVAVTGQVINAAGRVMWSGDISAAREIQVGSWPRGLYIVRLRSVSNGDDVARTVVLQ